MLHYVALYLYLFEDNTVKLKFKNNFKWDETVFSKNYMVAASCSANWFFYGEERKNMFRAEAELMSIYQRTVNPVSVVSTLNTFQ